MVGDDRRKHSALACPPLLVAYLFFLECHIHQQLVTFKINNVAEGAFATAFKIQPDPAIAHPHVAHLQ